MAMLAPPMFRILMIWLVCQIPTPAISCGGPYDQCGGNDFTGATCCVQVQTCNFVNPYYSQCLPGGSSPTPTPSPSPLPSPSPTPSPDTSGPNPFAGQAWYVNPSYRGLLPQSINQTTGTVRDTLMQMQNIQSAFWVDVKSKIRKGQDHQDHHTVEGILEDAAGCNLPRLVVFIVYDLPNRD